MLHDMYATPEGFELYKPLLLPDARSFADVLEYLGEWDQFKDPPAGRVIGNETGYRRTGNEIGPFCVVAVAQPGIPSHRSIAVRATDAVIDVVTPRLVTPDDSLSFDIIEHADRNRALVILKHNYIIGYHWLAYIDPATIAAYPYTRRDERYRGICESIKEDGKDPFVKRLAGGEIEVRVIVDRGRAPDFRRTLDPNLKATVHNDGSVTRVWADGTIAREAA